MPRDIYPRSSESPQGFYSRLWIPIHAGSILGLIIFLSACIPILYLWIHSSRALDQEMRVSLLETAQSAALLVDGERHKTFTRPEQETEKAVLVQVAKMRRFMYQNPRLTSLSTYIMHDGKVHVVLDTNSGGEGGEPIGIMSQRLNPSPELVRALAEHEAGVEAEPYATRWGTFVSGYAPIYDSTDQPVAVIGAEISIEELAASKKLIRQSGILGLGLALLCAVGSAVGIYALQKRMQHAASEARAADEARAAAEVRYHNLFAQIPIGVIYYNNDMIITDCNQRILQIGHIEREKLIGKDLNQLGSSRLLPCLKDALSNRESVYVGEYDLTPGSSNAWVEIHAGPIHDSEDRRIGGIATVEDITSRHQAEMMSEAEKELLGLIARGERLNDIFVKLTESIEFLIPGSLCSIHLLDAKKERLLRGTSKSLPREYIDLIENVAIGPNVGSCGAAAATGEPVITVDIQTDPLWKDYLEVADRFGLRACWSMPIKIGGNEVSGTFAIYHRNVYKPSAFDRTILENASFLAGIAIERSRFEKTMSEERTLLRTLIDNIPDIIVIKDRHHRYLAANKAAMQKLGAKEEKDIVGRTDSTLLPPDEALANHDVEAKVLEGQNQLDTESTETDTKGNVVFMSTSRMPLRNAEGEIIGLITIGRNVTDRKRVDEERIKSQKLESLGILAGGIAHDFNNILTSVLGNLSYVTIAEKSLTPEGEELLKEAETAAQRAKDLTQQLLTFAKGGLPVKNPTNVADLIRDAATFALRGSSSKLEIDFPDDLWMVEMDGGQISQAIQNLAFNADQAMPQGGTVLISGRNRQMDAANPFDLPAGRYVAVTVKDQGTGIPEHVQKRIFDPYFTTKKAGNGLGLTTTFSIIKKHGGSIYVDSRVNEGAAFTFLLPALESAAKARPSARTSPSKGTPGHVLIMDDEEAIRKISSRILENAGFKVTTACDGQEALDAFTASSKTVQVDVVVLDLTIPGGMGGKETFEKLKEIDPHVRAIVSSGYSVDEIMARHEAFGFVGVVTKPYDRTQLINAINAALSTAPA